MSPQPLSEPAMREAIARRDPSRDGAFVYAVITTGVYCRPSCAARPARPENLRFFAAPSDAQAAGFRPCKRCAPNDPSRDVARLAELARFIETHSEETLTLAALARRIGWSPAHLQRRFTALLGLSPKAFQAAARAEALKRLLRASDDVTGAGFEAGYGSLSRLYADGAARLGMTPSAYRRGGAGEALFYACRDTPFGLLAMAASGRGVCFVMFGDSEAALVSALAREFPNAALQPAPGGAQLETWTQALCAYLAGAGPSLDAPLDLRGTAFQRSAWSFLSTIPRGETVSYGAMAQGLGVPRGARAAASACARNRIAVLVPCHRVLRGDGALGGYRWGEPLKRALLALERRGA